MLVPGVEVGGRGRATGAWGGQLQSALQGQKRGETVAPKGPEMGHSAIPSANAFTLVGPPLPRCLFCPAVMFFAQCIWLGFFIITLTLYP